MPSVRYAALHTDLPDSTPSNEITYTTYVPRGDPRREPQNYVALHTGPPVGTQSSNEVDYRGYSRVALESHPIYFPMCEDYPPGGNLITHWSVGDHARGDTPLTVFGSLNNPILITMGVSVTLIPMNVVKRKYHGLLTSPFLHLELKVEPDFKHWLDQLMDGDNF